MKVYNDINIPASVVMTDKAGKKRVLDGKLISINESTNTCVMDIHGKVFDNVELNNVYLNEAFLDTLKDKGKALWRRIKNIAKSVGGFLLPISEAGKQIVSFLNTPINLSMMKLPKSVSFFPCLATQATVEECGGRTFNSADADPYAEAEAADKAGIEKYWSRVMKEYVANESLTVSDTVKLVNEKYYVNKFKGVKALNETSIPSLHNVGGANYGEELSYVELVDRLKDEIMLQLEPTSEGIDPKSIIIWGAPGIGKTAVLKKAQDLVKENNYNLDMAVIKCASLKRDDFELPDTVKNLVNQKVAISTCKTWLPCYDTAGLSEKEIAKIDAFYNCGAYKIYSRAGLAGKVESDASDDNEEMDIDSIIDNAKFNGGIIFFDEFSRLDPAVTDIMMNLMGERQYMHMPLASKWLCLGASNRLSDDLKSENDDNFRNVWGVAKQDRYKHYTYVPTMQEWLNWARQPGSDGKQHIDEMFCEFIEKSGEGVWYDALDLGSRPDVDKDVLRAITTGGDDAAEIIGDYLESHDTKEAKDLHTWTPRTWEQKINAPIKSSLNQLFRNTPGGYESIFSTTVREDEWGDKIEVQNIDDNKLKSALMEVPAEDWKGWAKGKQPKADPNKAFIKANDRYSFVKSWITNVVLPEQFGKGSLPAEKWKTFERVQNILSPESIEYIWSKGRLNGRRVCKEDDLMFATHDGYNQTETAKWKCSQDLISQVFKQILDAYTDAELQADQDSDMKRVMNMPQTVSPADYAKLKEQYKVTVVDADSDKEIVYYPLFESGPYDDDDLKCAQSLLVSKVAQKFVNFAKYAGKICIQTKIDNIAEIAERMITEKVLKSRSTKASEFYAQHKDAFSALLPAYTILTTIRQRDI